MKLLGSDMDNLEDRRAEEFYGLQEVPWVMYFQEGYGIHGTYWHDSFGKQRSHGCVNLSPKDAEHLFWWSRPHLPAGWTAALPTPYEPGSRVRVRHSSR